jgi:hypothetical protein
MTLMEMQLGSVKKLNPKHVAFQACRFGLTFSELAFVSSVKRALKLVAVTPKRTGKVSLPG